MVADTNIPPGRAQPARAEGADTVPDDARLRPAKGQAEARAELVNLANAVTLGRLCLVPASVWLVLRGHCFAAFWLFLAAGASDAVDGWLARRRGTTSVGALLDPVADKVLLVSMYVTLAATHELPDWLAILVVFRDVAIVGGVLALSVLGWPLLIRPLFVSKLNTVLQIALVAVVLLRAGMGFGGPLVTPLVWLVTASTLLSGAAYVVRMARPR
jgi:cardiolipin synthase